MNFLSSEEIAKLSDQKSLIQRIYESKCLHPSENDILNCIQELQLDGLILLIRRYWNEDDVTFGNQIRERFKQDFLEVSHIEVLEKLIKADMLKIISGPHPEKPSGQKDEF